MLVVRDSTSAAMFSGGGMGTGDGWAWAERDLLETLPVEKLAAATLTVPVLRPGRARAAALKGETIDEMTLRDNIIAAGIVGYLGRRKEREIRAAKRELMTGLRRRKEAGRKEGRREGSGKRRREGGEERTRRGEKREKYRGRRFKLKGNQKNSSSFGQGGWASFLSFLFFSFLFFPFLSFPFLSFVFFFFFFFF